MEQTDHVAEMVDQDSGAEAPLALRAGRVNRLSGQTGQDPPPLPGIPINSHNLIVRLLFLPLV